MNSIPLPRAGKVDELESIRGLAAMLVVLFHISEWNSILQHFTIVKNGYLMVDLFFVLSGFVICTAYSTNITNPKQLARFQFLRFGRLYPVHILFLGLFFLADIMKYWAKVHFGLSSPCLPPFRTSNLIAFFQQVFLLQAIGPTDNATSFNSPAWSISVEFYTYFIFGILLLTLKRWKNVGFFILAAASVLGLYFKVNFGFGILMQCTAGFFVGCLTATMKTKANFRIPSIIPALVFLIIIVFLFHAKNTTDPLVMYALSALLILGITLSGEGTFKTILKMRPFKWLGEVSYSVYMSHAFILWMMTQFLTIALKKHKQEGVSTVILPQYQSIVADLCFLTLVLLISYFTNKFIEKPFRAKSREIASAL